MSLSKLPYEIISLIVQELDLDDVFHLGLLRRFHYLIKEDRVCKAILEVTVTHTLEPCIPSLTDGIRDSGLGFATRHTQHGKDGIKLVLTKLWRSQAHAQPQRPKKQNRLTNMPRPSAGSTRGDRPFEPQPPSRPPSSRWRTRGSM